MEYFFQFITNHWVLFSVFISLLVILCIYEWHIYKQQAKKISPQEAVLLMNHDARVFDCREIAQFKKSHILNAIHVTQDAKVPESSTTPTIIVCESGYTAQGLASKWKQAGVEHIHVLSGGMRAWKEAGLPMTHAS